MIAPPGVYTLTNETSGNAIAAYTRATNGNLTRRGTFPTGGNGLGAGLGSQGALVFQPSTGRFFAVNAGSNSISMLALQPDGSITRLATVASGGIRPISVTVYGSYVYVANEGDRASAAANITGFQVSGIDLTPIAGSTQALSVSDPRPGQVAFTRDGQILVVTEKATHKIATFVVTNGVAGGALFQNSAGMTPFAFDFSPEGVLVVAEVGSSGSGPNSSVSSYTIATDGMLTPVTSALATNQAAACWIATAGGAAYVANAASATITGVNVAIDGTLTLRDSSGVTANTGAGAIDLALSPDNGFLYSLAGGPDTISIFEVGAEASLAARPTLSSVPPTAAGLVAR